METWTGEVKSAVHPTQSQARAIEDLTLKLHCQQLDLMLGRQNVYVDLLPKEVPMDTKDCLRHLTASTEELFRGRCREAKELLLQWSKDDSTPMSSFGP